MMKTNYSHVSILSCFYKRYWGFEVIMSEQLMHFIGQIINDMISAYCKKYGCEHVLLKVFDLWK